MNVPSTQNTWAIADDFAEIIRTYILENKPELVMELGSGYSTLIIGQALQTAQTGKLISIEHDAHYLEHTKTQLDTYQLNNIVDLWYCPLVSNKGFNTFQPWYSLPSLSSISLIDLLIIDGPPGNIAKLSRYPALPLLWDKLSDNATIMLDDAKRQDEQKVVSLWLEKFSDLRVEYLPTKKGTAILKKLSV